ncbi:hypothetical protein BDW22DRAFT_597614 [Trametopsis cervina]|nr:hypothetical protein BDW22DRAFT_597614 [Trametopsis cervina]
MELRHRPRLNHLGLECRQSYGCFGCFFCPLLLHPPRAALSCDRHIWNPTARCSLSHLYPTWLVYGVHHRPRSLPAFCRRLAIGFVCHILFSIYGCCDLYALGYAAATPQEARIRTHH